MNFASINFVLCLLFAFCSDNDIIILNEEYLENVILEIGLKDKKTLDIICEKEINVKNIQFLKESDDEK